MRRARKIAAAISRGVDYRGFLLVLLSFAGFRAEKLAEFVRMKIS